MFCGECGTENPDTNQFCKNCGKPLKKKQLPPEPAPVQSQPGPKKPGTSKKWLIIGAIIAVVIIAGIFILMQSGSPANGSPASTAKASETVHGTISTGAMTTAAQGSVPATGGTITVNQPGSAIDGLEFTAPAGAYPSGQQVTISSAPVTGTTFGNNFNPATPLITIDAGTAYADDMILVTIPVTIPEDQFAMAFYYDDVNEKLEGIPTASQDGKSITIATRHFSMISLVSLNGIDKADSGFRPGVDDWEFVNDGSIIAPKGHCAGQSTSMMWYYTEQRQKANAPPLFNRYDNNGRDPATPKVDRDNTVGYRYASVMQAVTTQGKYWANSGDIISNVSPLNTFREFKYSMLMTGEPQFVYIARTGGGHAIVCYEVSDTTLWVADPNYPGKERYITLNGSTLGPYTSGASSSDIKENGVRIYPKINYIAKSAMFSWPELAAEYAKVEDGTIGDPALFAPSFPEYEIGIFVINDEGSEKEAGRMIGGKNTGLKQIDVEEKTVTIRFTAPVTTFGIYLRDGTKIQGPTITLSEGSNIIGLETFDDKDRWLGLDWIDLEYKPKITATPTTAAGHYTAYMYAILPSMQNDPDCNNYNYYSDDPGCGSARWTGLNTNCGKLPEKCIDYSFKDGISEEITYIGTLDDKTMHRILDGYDRTFSENGVVTQRTKYENDVMIENCRSSHKKELGKFECTITGNPDLQYTETL